MGAKTMDEELAGLNPNNFSEFERNMLGLGDELDEDTITSVNMPHMAATAGVVSQPIPGVQGKVSDEELILFFEGADDARFLYNFLLDEGMVEKGEIQLTITSSQSSVHFQPSVLIGKPEVIRDVLYALRDHVDEDTMEDYAEAAAELVEFTIYHNKMGEFDSAKRVGRMKAGSIVKPGQTTKKKKVSGYKGGKVLSGFTKSPCGRTARDQGQNVRCWDGANMAKAASKGAQKLAASVQYDGNAIFEWPETSMSNLIQRVESRVEAEYSGE